jgi:hypothetical protein
MNDDMVVSALAYTVLVMVYAWLAYLLVSTYFVR